MSRPKKQKKVWKRESINLRRSRIHKIMASHLKKLTGGSFHIEQIDGGVNLKTGVHEVVIKVVDALNGLFLINGTPFQVKKGDDLNDFMIKVHQAMV